MRKLLFSCLLLLFGASTLSAQGSEAAMVRFGINPGNGHVGDTATFFISVVPRTGWHVYSAQPSEEGAYEPALVSWDITSLGFEAVGDLQEEGRLISQYDDIMGGTVRYYEDKILFSQSIVLTEGEVLLTGTFEYMACNELKCVPYYEEFNVPFKAKE